MTRSEILTMMVGGMATIAGGVFAIYAGMGVQAGHLLTASFMAAPTALYLSKILLPETEKSETADGTKEDPTPSTHNALDAMCQGCKRRDEAHPQCSCYADRLHCSHSSHKLPPRPTTTMG